MWDVKSCTLVDGNILSDNHAVSVLGWEKTNSPDSSYTFARNYHITNILPTSMSQKTLASHFISFNGLDQVSLYQECSYSKVTGSKNIIT